jgi:hypothetical protein
MKPLITETTAKYPGITWLQHHDKIRDEITIKAIKGNLYNTCNVKVEAVLYSPYILDEICNELAQTLLEQAQQDSIISLFLGGGE